MFRLGLLKLGKLVVSADMILFCFCMFGLSKLGRLFEDLSHLPSNIHSSCLQILVYTIHIFVLLCFGEVC